jgi:arylformamidase
VIVDLTHELHSEIPRWPTHTRYSHDLVESHPRHFGLTLSEHSGTHLDAPCHFVPGGRSIADQPLADFFGRAACIPVTAGSSHATRAHLERWQDDHGKIRPGDAVLLAFGWDRYWPDGGEFGSWPALALDAAEYLAGLGTRLVGTDTCSPDEPGAIDAPVHRTLLGAGVLIGENFRGLTTLPPWCDLITLPLPIKDGTGSPVRAVAVVPDDPGDTAPEE